MKILYVTTISLTMNSFFVPHIEMLVQKGHQVDIACNAEKLPLNARYEELGCKFYQIDFSRSPLSSGNFRAYRQLKALIKDGGYDIVHCHTPNASVITRLVCRSFRKSSGLQVFYTAHGFHFFKGAPKLNWMVYYPVEKFCARYTDKLITINKEDYEVAKAHFKAKQLHYIPGVGIDLSKYENVRSDASAVRQAIGVPEKAFMLLSVGEINVNKNHKVIVKALALLQDPNIHYVLAGRGDQEQALMELAQELEVSDQVHLLGYRKDIPDLIHAADVFCFPSYREGLGVAALEAMAGGLPVLTSNVHGINDYSESGKTGFKFAPEDIRGFTQGIYTLVSKPDLRRKIRENNLEIVKAYTMETILDQLSKLYESPVKG